jgi:hypothetical protein
VRRELDRHGLLDVGNYGKHMLPLKAYFNVNGSGRNSTYKVKYEGRQRSRDLAKTLLAG